MISIRRTLMNVLLLAASTSILFAADQQPNIIVLFADDLGYGELSCQDNPEIPTPHIDSIASNLSLIHI